MITRAVEIVLKKIVYYQNNIQEINTFNLFHTRRGNWVFKNDSEKCGHDCFQCTLATESILYWAKMKIKILF